MREWRGGEEWCEEESKMYIKGSLWSRTHIEERSALLDTIAESLSLHGVEGG